MSLEVVRKDGSWWITNTGSEVGDFGPYETKAQAEDDARGIKAFHKYEMPETD